jgi:hypothetical protein
MVEHPRRRSLLASTGAFGASGAAGCLGREPDATRNTAPSTVDTREAPDRSRQRQLPGRHVLPEHDSVSGSGTPTDPYVSPSGTAGLRELLDDAGGGTVIYAPPGRYDLDSTLTVTTSNVSLIGHRPAKISASVGSVEDSPASEHFTIFNAVGSRDADPERGGILHYSGEQGDDVTGWTVRNLQLSNTGGVERAAVSSRRFAKFDLRGLAFGDAKPDNGWVNGWFFDSCYIGMIADWQSSGVGCTIYSTRDFNDLTIQNVMLGTTGDRADGQGRGAIHITSEDGSVPPRGINLIHPHVSVHGDVGMTLSGLGITVQTAYVEGKGQDYTAIDLIDPHPDRPTGNRGWASDTIRVVGGWFFKAGTGIRFGDVSRCKAAYNHFHVLPGQLDGENDTAGIEVTSDAEDTILENNAFVGTDRGVVDRSETTTRLGRD